MGCGALSDFAAFPACTPQHANSANITSESRLRPRTAWVINDTVSGVLFKQLQHSGFEVSRCVDSRLFNSSGTAQIKLLEDLKLSKPALLCGILRAPATHVGTSVERNFSQRLSDLLALHGQQGVVSFSSVPCKTDSSINQDFVLSWSRDLHGRAYTDGVAWACEREPLL